VAAHLGDGGLGGDAGPRAALIEHDGDGLAAQGALEVLGDEALLDVGLVGLRGADEGDQFGGGEVGDGEEMARGEGGDGGVRGTGRA